MSEGIAQVATVDFDFSFEHTSQQPRVARVPEGQMYCPGLHNSCLVRISVQVSAGALASGL